jgi:hypothetical protein
MAVFRIPRQTDRALVRALISIREDLNEFGIPFQIRVLTLDVGGAPFDLPENEPEAAPTIEPILLEQSEIMPWLELRHNNHALLRIKRELNQISDEVSVAYEQNSLSQIKEDARTKLVPRLIASARRHLRAADGEANLTGGTDSQWNRYRDSQLVILRSLEETQQSIIRDFARARLQLEADAKTKLDQQQNDFGSQAEGNTRATFTGT